MPVSTPVPAKTMTKAARRIVPGAVESILSIVPSHTAHVSSTKQDLSILEDSWAYGRKTIISALN